MDESMRKKAVKSVKEYALDCVPDGASDEEIYRFLEMLGEVFDEAADWVRKRDGGWKF